MHTACVGAELTPNDRGDRSGKGVLWQRDSVVNMKLVDHPVERIIIQAYSLLHIEIREPYLYV